MRKLLTKVSEKTDKVMTVFPDLKVDRILASFRDGGKFLVGSGVRESRYDGKRIIQSFWDIYVVDIREKSKKFLFQEAYKAQLSPDEKYIAVVDKNSTLYVLDVNGNSKKLISPSVDSSWELPKFWCPQGEKLAFTVCDDEVSLGTFVYDLPSDSRRCISTPKEDKWYYSSFLAWEDAKSLLVLEAQPDDRLDAVCIKAYDEFGNHRLLKSFKAVLPEDISVSYMLVKHASSDILQLYCRKSYVKIGEVNVNLQNKLNFRESHLIGDTGKAFIKEFTGDGIKTRVKTSVYDFITNKEEIVSNDISDLGE